MGMPKRIWAFLEEDFGCTDRRWVGLRKYRSGTETEYLRGDIADRLADALEDLWSWVDNWNPEFVEDEEFDADKYENAIKTYRSKSQ